jgi:iron complex transport system permease protein
VLAVGDDEARSLGVTPPRVRLIVLAAASLGTAAAVAVSGLIGFVGLVVPHIVRRLVGGSYRTVLPMSLLGGAAFLVAADLLARTLLAPAEVPIGVVTAFVGAPFFAVLLRGSGGQGS